MTAGDESFYNLDDGAIGLVHYRINIADGLTDEQKQDIVSRNSNARMRAWINNFTYGMNGNGPDNPADAYAKARSDSWGDLDDNFIEMRNIYVQVGQKESVDKIVRIENSKDFVGWSNPEFIKLLKLKINGNR